MFGFSTYSFIVYVHVFAAFVLVGSSLSAPLTRKIIREAGTLGELRGWLAFARRSARWNPAASLLLLGSGIYLGSIGWWSQSWFWVAISIWVLNLLLMAFVVKRAAATLARAAFQGGDGPVNAEIDALRGSPRWDLAADAVLANDLAILWIMMNKPALLESLFLLVAGNAILIVARLARRRTGSPLSALSSESA